MSTTAASVQASADKLTMDRFAEEAAKVLKPNVNITRDSLAKLILLTNGSFGNLQKVSSVVNPILHSIPAKMVLSASPAGPIIPVAVDLVFRLALAPQTKFGVEYVLYRVWLLLPKSANDRYTVTSANGQIKVADA